MEIGEILKRLRVIYGIKASQMADNLELSTSYLSEIENNKKQPNLRLLEKYAEIFQIKLSSIILLAESHEEMKMRGQGDEFIRKIMIMLINSTFEIKQKVFINE